MEFAHAMAGLILAGRFAGQAVDEAAKTGADEEVILVQSQGAAAFYRFSHDLV